jgi:hypothetical protein
VLTAGYLPCFWVKLRNLAVAAPEVHIPVRTQAHLGRGVASWAGAEVLSNACIAQRLRSIVP